MKTYLLLLSICSSLIFSSCTVQKKSTSKTLDIYGAGVIQTPVLVDLNVSPTKIYGTVEGTTSSGIESLKNSAVSVAIEKANADLLVEPSYTIETEGSRVIVTVSGFPATYNNFRTITKEDVPLLEAGITQKAQTNEGFTEKDKKNGGVVAIVFTLIALIVAGAVITTQ